MNKKDGEHENDLSSIMLSDPGTQNMRRNSLPELSTELELGK